MISRPRSGRRERRRSGAMNIGASVHGRIRKSGPERRVALHGLEELREQEDRAEHAEEHERARRCSRARTSGCGRTASAASGSRARSSQSDERGDEHARRASSEPTICGLAQPSPLPRTRPQTMPNRPALASPSPGRSSLPAGPVRLGQPREAERDQQRARSGRSARRSTATRSPRRPRRRRAGPNATARPLIPPHAPSASPRFSAGTAALRIVSVSGITIAPPSPCTARAMFSTSTDGARRRGDRAEREDADADREDAPATEAVAERGSGEEQHREGQRVGVDRPLEALERRVEVRADHGDRGRDHEVVERDHEQRDRGDHERPEGLASGDHLGLLSV